MKSKMTLLFFVAVGCANGYMLGSSGPPPAGAQTAPASTVTSASTAQLQAQIQALEARLAAVEQKTQDMTRGVSSDGKVPYVTFSARVGVFTKYWCEKPLNEGAALSVGTAVDRFAGYFEIDQAVATSAPSTAIYASVVAPNATQPNVAIEAHAKNAAAGCVALYADSQYAPGSNRGTPVTPVVIEESDGGGTVQRSVVLSANGVTLRDGAQAIVTWTAAKVGGSTRALWP